jgi:dolichyl-diphosphooligosaccharide--protein glycosyltransferase
VLFFASTAVFVTLFTDFNNFKQMYGGPLGFVQIKEVGRGTIWPNVYTTVAEQNELSWNGVIDNLGGQRLFILVLIGALLSFTKRDRFGKIEPRYAVLIIMWIAATAYASTKGVRWVLLMVPAISIAFGILVGVTVRYLGNYLSSGLSVNKTIVRISLVILFTLLLIQPFNRAVTIARNEVPSMNDAWAESLTLIKTNSTQDAIINSWWDFGHWFKYWADRAVTFDGTSQTGPRAHFIGLTLLTDSEDEAVGILRMLDCSGDEAFLVLEDELEDGLAAVTLLKQIIPLDADDAREVLLDHVGSDIADELIELTKCDPPENYFITSEDMVGKSGVWAHFGSWNFTRFDMVRLVRQEKPAEGKRILEERFGLSEQEANRYYVEITTQDPNHWIAPWPSVASGAAGCQTQDDMVSCGNGLQLNLTSGDAYIDSGQGRLYPRKYSYVSAQGDFLEGEYENNTIRAEGGQEFGVAFFPEGDSYASILMSPELVSSMFTRLFYYQGIGLRYFDFFHFARDITGLDIFIWKVDWEGE